MTYTWKGFEINEAVSGILVGVPGSGHVPSQGGTATENIDDISKVAGRLVTTKGYLGYKVAINGKTAYIDQDGKVIASTPSTAFSVGQQLYLATTEILEYTGTEITRSAASEEGYSQIVSLSTIEPRDTFAIQILSSMLVHSGNPESFDDASIMLYARASYRWAQAMMDVAANTRHGESTSQSTNISVNTNDLQSNVEKLLYNMSKSLEQGVIVKGSNELGAEPVHTKVTIDEMPDVTIDSMPDLTVDGLENVTDSYKVPEIKNAYGAFITINIVTSIFKQKYIRFEFTDYMAYSDISVYMELAVKEGETATTRKVGFVIPKNTIVNLNPLDDAVTEITSITTKIIRGKGGNDPNTYALVNPT